MNTFAVVLTGLVAALHVYFLVLEMFFWDRPTGRRIFGTTPDFAKASRNLAANQGLYNGFLAAGLIWGLALGTQGIPIREFFLICVLIAGIYGGFTVNRRILLVQGIPAALALWALLPN
jgi:putative membrane protein